MDRIFDRSRKVMWKSHVPKHVIPMCGFRTFPSKNTCEKHNIGFLRGNQMGFTHFTWHSCGCEDIDFSCFSEATKWCSIVVLLTLNKTDLNWPCVSFAFSTHTRTIEFYVCSSSGGLSHSEGSQDYTPTYKEKQLFESFIGHVYWVTQSIWDGIIHDMKLNVESILEKHIWDPRNQKNL